MREKPCPPCLNTTRLQHRPYREHPAEALHRGWVAAQRGRALDQSESPAFKEGYAFWYDVQLDMGIRALRRAQAEMRRQAEAKPAEMPRVFPWDGLTSVPASLQPHVSETPPFEGPDTPAA